MITAEGLRKVYGNKAAVDDLSFDVHPGVVTGFLGPNGAGKSTTMRLMLGLDRGEGTALFDGRPFRDIQRPMREVGAVLEAKAFHPTRSARNHLRMLAAANDIPRSRIDEVFELVGLTDVRNAKPRGFSLGMAQRLGLAQALLGDPQYLILDEPANGLDPHGIQWLRDVLKSLASGGRTIFVSSHLLAEMAQMADELVVIGRRQMIASGPVSSFVSQFTHSTVVVRGPALDPLIASLRDADAQVTSEPDGALVVEGVDAASIGERAHQVGVVLHELSPRSASLEQAFLSATGASEEFVGAVTGDMSGGTR